MACGLCLLAACSSPPPATPSRVEATEGYSLSFPDHTSTRTGRDGRAAFRIDFARTADDARFEAAWFGFPEALEADEQAALLDRVEHGLAGQDARVVSREQTIFEGRATLDLVFDRPDGRRGFHRVLYPSARSMLQVSAVGPKDGPWEQDVPRFWASLILTGDTLPVSRAAGTAE